MDKFKQLGKSLRKDKDDTEQNTRRVQANFPLIERKLDLIAGDSSYRMEFPVTNRNHAIHLNLRVKPDNCCDCVPGGQTVVRDAVGYWDLNIFGTGDGIERPAIYTEPLVQTGTNFNYGYSSPFFYPSYQAFPYIAGYTINPAGGIVVPVDGMYAVLFKVGITLSTDSNSALILSIKQNGIVISRKVYSAEKMNITSGFKAYYQYAFCVPLHAGDTVSAWIQASALSFDAGGGYGNIDNSTRIALLGLGFGILIGFVKDNITGAPILNAVVSYTIGFGGSTTTGPNGDYIFEELTPGPYSVTASMAGYVSMTRDVTVVFNEVAELDFNLSPV